MRLLFLGLLAVLALALVLPQLAAVALASQGLVGEQAIVAGTGGKGVKVRSGPGLSYSVAGTLGEGSEVRVTDGPQSEDDLLWYRVRGRDDDDERVRGWIAATYLIRAVDVKVRNGDLVGTRSFTAKVTSYASGHGAGDYTATGTRVRWGTVAVDPKFIPLGSLMTIDGLDGVFAAEDTGGSVTGSIIDVWFPDLPTALDWGTRQRTVTILREGY